MVKLIILILSLFSISCATTTSYIYLKKTSSQKEVFQDGLHFIYSETDKAKIVFNVSPENYLNRTYLSLSFYLENKSDKSYNFSPFNVMVGRKTDRRKLHVYSYQEMLEKAENSRKSQQAFNAIAYGLSAGLNGYANSGRGNQFVNFLEKVDNRNQFQNTFNAIEKNSETNKKAIKQGLIKKTTIFPNQYLSGKVMTDFLQVENVDKGDLYLVVVRFVGEKHRFFFKITNKEIRAVASE